MTDIQAVFSDLDGTLLNSSHKISRATAAAIRRLGERGVHFVPVSGRGPQGIDLVLEAERLRCPIKMCIRDRLEKLQVHGPKLLACPVCHGYSSLICCR